MPTFPAADREASTSTPPGPSVRSIRHPLTRALLGLTFTTGLIDAASFLGLGHVFTANMTGNVVLLGFGIAGSGGLPVVAPLISLGSFLIGATLAGRLLRRMEKDHPTIVASALAIEVSLLALAAVLAAVIDVHVGETSAYVIIAVMACALGARNAAVRAVAVPDLTTTVLTMTLTGFAAESQAAGGAGTGSARRLSAVGAMLVGAIAGALLLKLALWVPIALASVLGLVTWGLYARSLDRPPAAG